MSEVRATALFYRKRTGKNGEYEEVSLGPSAVGLLRWIIALLMAALLLAGGVGPAAISRLLMKALP